MVSIMFTSEWLHEHTHCIFSVFQGEFMFLFSSLFLTDLNSAMETQFTSRSTSRLVLGQNLDFCFKAYQNGV